AMEQVSDAILITDSSGRIKYANPAFHVMSGYSQEEILGKNIDLLQSTEHGKSIPAEAKSILVKGGSWRGRVRSRKKDRSFCRLDATVSPVRGHGERAINLVIVEREISLEQSSDREAWVDERREAGDRTAKQLAGVLENLLLGLTGYAHLAKDEVAGSDRGAGDLEQVMAIGKRACDLVAAIGALSGTDQEPAALVDMTEICLAVLQDLRRSKPENIDILDGIVPVETTVLASEEHVRLLITALFESVCLAMAPNGGSISVGLSEESIEPPVSHPPDGDPVRRAYARLAVSGTPRPESIAAPGRDRVLEIPSAGNPVRSSLAVARAVVEGLGGWLDIGDAGRPTVVFSAYLPIVANGKVRSDLE
ncbi:MAG: PAS domain S-box protein, partial [Pseudomonadota bacterium]